MKILVLSFYFEPDLCAGSFRATSLVDALCKIVPAGSQVNVVTTLPNRYHSFTVHAPQTEHQEGLSIFRISLPKHQSGLSDQSKAFFVFSREVIKHVNKQDYDIVFATSSRLMTAALGAWVARRKNARLYLDMRDIFADTIKDILPQKISWMIKPFFSVLEKWTVKQADRVNLISPGFSDYFTARYPKQQFSYFTNGIDEEFLKVTPAQTFTPTGTIQKRPVTVLYAGNLGEGQGLHVIIPKLAERMPQIHFKIIGDGGRKQVLESILSKIDLTNVELLTPIKRDKLLAAYDTADILFLHLNDYDAFKKVLPSKLFEYASLGKPIWAGVSGYAAEFIKSEIHNAAVFHPCDVEAAVKSFNELTLQITPRTDFINKYARKYIDQKMARDILSIADNTQ